MQEEVKKHAYKVEIGDEIIVWKNEVNNNTFYNVQVQKKNYDGTKEKFYKNLKFRKGVDLLSGSKIRIIDMFEDVRTNPNDKFNPIWSLFILDFVEIKNEELEKEQAFKEYQNNLSLSENPDLMNSDPFAGFDDTVSIDDNFLD